MHTQLVIYKTMPEWNKDTLPTRFRQPHNTQEGTWAQLTIKQGELDFELLGTNGEIISELHLNKENQPPLIEPQQWHRIANISDNLICQISFYCQKEDFPKKKYGFSRAHSEVIEALNLVPSGKTLDLGCGEGRNSIYLALNNFDITALDINEIKIKQLKHIIHENNFSNFKAAVYDIHEANIQDSYDFIISTVVLLMLDTTKIPAIIHNMQSKTNLGGYHLIVSVMDTVEHPCDVNFFKHKFKENELKQYYKNWAIIKYNENIGKMHQLDPLGNPYEFQFATLLAKKI